MFSQNNVIHYGKRVEILLHLVSFCPRKSKINSFLHIQFSQLLLHSKEKNIISCFLISFTHQVEFFCWYLLIFWPFIYWTLNKRCFETWSRVCGYCAYGLFLCFHSLWNIPKNARELGVGRSQFYAGVNGLKAPEVAALKWTLNSYDKVNPTSLFGYDVQWKKKKENRISFTLGTVISS